MQNRFDFGGERIYALHFATDSSQPPEEDSYAADRRAYGERLEETACMLLREDWYTLTKDSEVLQTIISSIKDVASNLKNMENMLYENDNIDVHVLVRELLSIISCLYRAGERSTELEFAIRQVRFEEFSQCYESLETAAKLLTQ